MVDVERIFTVRKPVDTVIEYLKDFSHSERWDPGTVSCRRTGSGPLGVGAEWHNVTEFRGKKTELTYRLDRAEPGRLVFVGTNKTVTSTDDLTLTALGEGTRVTYRATITFHGLAKLADPFLKREFERLGDEVVSTMTETLEAL
ncbi:SRPBCC family protein [Amycolatopsis minnesotensis]|uniref:SRPBCC family protein n=1 Tax=Amycolatopsis minnesotensis TaxID=337894 RepID=A0ABN2QD58_9PSEU